MIARIWHGVVEADKADEYLEYLNETGIPDYQSTRGNRGAYVLRRIENEAAHFYTLSFWDSLSSIKEFASEDYEKAKYYPKDAKFLRELEPTVQHFDVFG